VGNAVKIKKKDSSTRSCRRKSGKKGEMVWGEEVALGVSFPKQGCANERIWKTRL
jgi:hypothetical protein